MKQIPPVPKLRRALRLGLVRALGAKAALGLAGPAASEQAALRLRLAGKGRALPAPERVRFILPLVAPHHVQNWPEIQARLSATLQSFLNQSDPRWEAVICSQTMPDLPDDPRIRFLPFTDQVDGNDKWQKQGALCRDLRDTPMPSGYVMPFDADDLLHRDAVAEMLTRQDPGGYLCVRGYVNDFASNCIGVTGPQTLTKLRRKPFWKLCGSCAAIRYTPDLPEAAQFLEAMTAHEHRMFPYLAKLAGLPLTPFRTPAVMYILNHGENFTARLNQLSSRSRFAERFPLTDKDEMNSLRDVFPTLAP
ncbi:hypothetical protein [Pseudoprimorskyibacter insulae]|uniref:Glycosyltransferase 2-like domain-containing protein n=1 Tax=Pseudoprimorskyibacter insulae TaxID=1695997 RepID=A0A2R8AR76_9RHOB|nr:hypothetical protein [Pseudoprimorskyibacter insulae]SPF78470.1 hypothetical protein PRI8871_01073 [Pseudoprimorskyibacter insulae]